eukprot:COSAG02_NODE_2375_length_9016_cov_3.763598_2_plen_157_part_00
MTRRNKDWTHCFDATLFAATGEDQHIPAQVQGDQQTAYRHLHTDQLELWQCLVVDDVVNIDLAKNFGGELEPFLCDRTVMLIQHVVRVLTLIAMSDHTVYSVTQGKLVEPGCLLEEVLSEHQLRALDQAPRLLQELRRLAIGCTTWDASETARPAC